MHRVSWLFILLLAWESSAALAANPRFETQDCPAPAAAAGARCGVVQVPENHANPRGRKIALHVVVLPATGKRDGQRAQYDLEGGPGFAVTDFLGFYASDGAAYRETRDIVLADMRGTGLSNPLRCPAIEETQRRQPTPAMYPAELVADCAKTLGGGNDLRQYTTGAAARDIDLVRRALGYEQLDLNAISYGTTLALRYIADFPKAVHAAALMGTVPASRTPPRFHAAAAQVALDQLMAECAADDRCRNNGDMRANLATALARVGTDTGVTAPVFLEKVRTHLYVPASRVELPYLLANASKGDFSKFVAPAGEGRVFADGLYLSITCTESFARMNVDAAIADARSTAFGAFRLERQRDACRQWPTGVADPRLMPEPDSRVPVLFIAGEHDPVAPADWAMDAGKHFANGRVIRVRHGAHVLDGLTELDTCLDPVMIRFFDSASVRTLDVSCLAHMMPPAWGIPP